MSSHRAESRREPLDCVVRLVTPERIIVAHPLAGPARRFVAYLIDQALLVVLILAVVLLSLVLTMGSMRGDGTGLRVVYFLLTWGYGAFCEGVFNGQTLGKYCLGLRVVSERGVPISGAQAVLRNLVGDGRWARPLFFSDRAGEHDPVAAVSAAGRPGGGYDRRDRGAAVERGFTRIKEPEVDALLPWLPGRIAVGSDLARVLSDYVEVRGRFWPCAAPRWPSRWRGRSGPVWALRPGRGRCRALRRLSSSLCGRLIPR